MTKPISHIYIQSDYIKRYNKGTGIYYLEYIPKNKQIQTPALKKQVFKFTEAESKLCTTLTTLYLAIKDYKIPTKLYVHTKDKLDLASTKNYSEKETEIAIKLMHVIVEGGHEIEYTDDLDEELLKLWSEGNEKLLKQQAEIDKRKRYEAALNMGNNTVKNIESKSDIIVKELFNDTNLTE